MQKLTIELPDRTLAATMVEPPGDSVGLRGLLFVHGLGSGQRSYVARAATACRQLDAVCLTFDLTGHGDSSPGREPRLRDNLADVVAAYDRLLDNPRIDPARIGVCGASYGGYLAARLVGERSIRRLLLRAPALYDDAALDESHPRPLSKADADASHLFVGLNRAEVEVLVVESERDEVIPHAVIETYLRKCPEARHAVLAGAAHGLTRPEWNAAFVSLIVSWFAAL